MEGEKWVGWRFGVVMEEVGNMVVGGGVVRKYDEGDMGRG